MYNFDAENEASTSVAAPSGRGGGTKRAAAKAAAAAGAEVLKQQEREEGQGRAKPPPKPRGLKRKAVAAEKPCEGETKKIVEFLPSPFSYCHSCELCAKSSSCIILMQRTRRLRLLPHRVGGEGAPKERPLKQLAYHLLHCRRN